jgi:2-keto-3-deoxy-L-rhamnonate aldolase RhmA
MTVAKPNRVREKLKRGGIVTGTAIYSASPNVVESAGFSGIDFVRIDTEHAWRQDDSLDNMIRASNLSDTAAIVRVDRDDPALIRKALELGAGGILVPHVYTVEYAREVVSAARFPPLGTRGFGNLCASAAWGTVPANEWVTWSNAEPLVGVMIEHEKAMEHVDAILAVEGLDYVLFGPADYSISLGLGSPQIDHPKVQEGLKRTIAAAKAVGKHVMLGVGSDDAKIRGYVEMGVTMLEFGHDVAIVQNHLRGKVEQFS